MRLLTHGELHLGQNAAYRVPEGEAVALYGIDWHSERFHRILKQHIVKKIHLLTAQHILRNEQALTQGLILELTDKVAAGYKAGDIDAVTEKVIFNGIDAPLDAGVFLTRHSNKFSKYGATEVPVAMEKSV